MPSYLTQAQTVRAARASLGDRLAEAELRKAAKASVEATFDLFLSHSSEDAVVIAGVKALLERDGLTVYVDWVADPQLSRTRVTKETAAQLRTRMDQCTYLLYASSRASSGSKWMPWELGYFDGRRRGQVGILPIVASTGVEFRGVEYLGLYPLIEYLSIAGGPKEFARVTGPGQMRGQYYASTLRAMASR
jgi:hypothetical protein